MCVSLMERKGREEGRKEGRKEGRREGLKRGLERGMRKGLEKGLEEGLEKGLLEGKLAAARKMLAQGEPDEKILYFTEITPDQLEDLRRERGSSS